MWVSLIILFLAILLLSRTSFEIRANIEIHASIEQVWAAIIAFEQYHHWNSQLSFLGGNVAPKGKLHLQLATAGAKPYEFTARISAWKEKEQFAWLAITGIPGIFDGEHFFELKPLENGKTLLINRERYSGIVSQVFRLLPMMKTAPEGFTKMNLELKQYIEQTK